MMSFTEMSFIFPSYLTTSQCKVTYCHLYTTFVPQKTVRDSESLTICGREFQSVQAAPEKALSPELQRLDMGVKRTLAEEVMLS